MTTCLKPDCNKPVFADRKCYRHLMEDQHPHADLKRQPPPKKMRDQLGAATFRTCKTKGCSRPVKKGLYCMHCLKLGKAGGK